MKKLFLFLLPVALALPPLAAHLPARADTGDGVAGVGPQSLPVSSLQPMGRPRVDVLSPSSQRQAQHQVRIEGRVIIRISPTPPNARTRMLSDLPRRPLRSSYEEVDHDDCVPVANIVGVQPTADNRLLLFTRDRTILAATLERSCSAQAFYSGFYVERNDDGRLCVERDEIQSRAGASCEVAGFTRLVAVDG